MILDDIVRQKRLELGAIPRVDPSALPPAPRRFVAALGGKKERVALIAEVKKASPSGGVIAAEFDPVAIAREYREGGADAISVLTDAPFFQGSIEHLRRIAGEVDAPLLRKDFIIDERQIHEARLAGADSLLLIAAILDRKTLERFLSESRSLGMEPLTEVHDERELDLALEAGATIIGINNRDLKTFRIDPATTLRLLPAIPEGRIVVSESGVEGAEDVAALRGRVDAVLVGTSLMRSGDRRASVAALVAAGQ